MKRNIPLSELEKTAKTLKEIERLSRKVEEIVPFESGYFKQIKVVKKRVNEKLGELYVEELDR